MKILNILLLIINIIYCDEKINSLPFYIRKFPKVTPGVKELTLKFQIEVTRDLKTSEFKGVGSPAFQFTLLPPATLKYSSEVDALELSDVSISTQSSKVVASDDDDDDDEDEEEDEGDKDDEDDDLILPFVQRSNLIFDEEILDKCKFQDMLKIVGKMSDEYRSAIGYHTKKSLKTMLSTLSPKGTLAVDIKSVKYKSELKKGIYTWSGKFTLRDDIKTETSVNEYYDEFVLGLSIGDKGLEPDDDDYCITHHPISAAIMFKHFETTSKSFIGCRALDFDQANIDLLEPLHHYISPSSTYNFDNMKDTHTLTYKFRFDDKNNLSMIDSTFVDLVFNFSYHQDLIFNKKELCKPVFRPELAVASCTYDEIMADLIITVFKANLNLKSQYTVTFSFLNTPIPYSPFYERFDTFMSVFTQSSNYLKESDKSILDEIKKVGDSINAECAEPILALYKQTRDQLNMKNYLISSSALSANISQFLTLMYEVRKVGSNFHMYILVQQDDKLFTKKSKVEIEPKIGGIYKFLEPDEYDPISMIYVRPNPGVKIEDEKITIKLDVKKGKSPTSRNNFYVLGFEFKTDDDIFERFLDPRSIKFTIKYDDGNYLFDVIPHVLINPEYGYLNNNIKYNLWMYGPEYDYDKNQIILTFIFLKENHNNILMYFDMNEPKGISSIEGRILGNVKSSKIKVDGTKSIQFILEYPDEQEKLETIQIILNVEDILETKAETINVYIVADPTTSEKFDVSKEKNVLFSDKIDFCLIDYDYYGFRPCISEDTRFASSRFRSGDNANYLFAKIINCRRPWIPATPGKDPQPIEIYPKHKYNYTPTLRLIETLSTRDVTEGHIAKFIDERRFYEHTLYLLFDEMAVNIIRDQMIAASKCVKSDATCPDGDHVAILKNVVSNLSNDYLFKFSNVVVGYYKPNKLELYLARDFDKKIDFSRYETISDIEHSHDALERILNLGFANSNSDIMGSSFSVVVSFDVKKVEYLTRYLERYYTYKVILNNGYTPHPILVDIIPVDLESKLDAQSLKCTNDAIKLSDEDVINMDNIDDDDIYPVQTIYENLIYTNPVVPQINVEKIGSSTSLKGVKDPNKVLKYDRDDFYVFVDIKNKLKEECLTKPVETIPIIREIENSIKNAKIKSFSYNIIATCTSFGPEENSIKSQTYTLSYRDIKLGEYEILAKNISDDKLYEECDLTTLYKYMPDTPSFVEKKKTREPTIPDGISSYTIEKGIQKIKYGKPEVENEGPIRGDSKEHSKPFIEIILKGESLKKEEDEPSIKNEEEVLKKVEGDPLEKEEET